MLLSSNKITDASKKYINLKNTHVTLQGDDIIKITSTRDIEGQSVTFRVPNSKDTESWLEALTHDKHRTPLGSPLMMRAPMMPVLQESDEDSTDES